jgi:hypothetical protein
VDDEYSGSHQEKIPPCQLPCAKAEFCFHESGAGPALRLCTVHWHPVSASCTPGNSRVTQQEQSTDPRQNRDCTWLHQLNPVGKIKQGSKVGGDNCWLSSDSWSANLHPRDVRLCTEPSRATFFVTCQPYKRGCSYASKIIFHFIKFVCQFPPKNLLQSTLKQKKI